MEPTKSLDTVEVYATYLVAKWNAYKGDYGIEEYMYEALYSRCSEQRLFTEGFKVCGQDFDGLFAKVFAQAQAQCQ